MDKQNEILDEVDLEVWSARGERAPKARRYVIRVDRERYTVTESSITGRAILALAGKDPARTLLQQRVQGGGTRPIGPDQAVDLTEPGVERFITLPKNQTDGDSGTRRHFKLSADDTQYLESTGLTWETFVDAGQQWVLLRSRPLPVGYAPPVADVALALTGYPDAQIDMAFFCPAVACGHVVPNLSERPLDGRVFQQWSRHRTPEDPWRPGIDDIASHLGLVDHWLERELGGR